MTTRTRKTPRERAQAALDVENRRVKRLNEKVDETAEKLSTLQCLLGESEQRAAYLAQSPDLTDDTDGGDL